MDTTDLPYKGRFWVDTKGDYEINQLLYSKAKAVGYTPPSYDTEDNPYRQIIFYNNKSIGGNCMIHILSDYGIQYTIDQALEYFRQMKEEKEFKVGDIVVITKAGYGTSDKDVGLITKIVDNKSNKSWFFNYTVEIADDKVGNNDRYLDPKCLRHATPEEIKQYYEKQKELKIAGYKVRIGQTYIEVGCRHYPKSTVKAFIKFARDLNIQSVKVSGVEVSSDTLNKIYNKL